MRTIPRNWPRKPGDYPAMCDYCGVMWPRSKLRRDRAGNLVCPQEGNGADAVTLSLENAQAARRRRSALRHRDGGNIDRDDPARPGDVLDVLGSSVVHSWFRAEDATLDDSGLIVTIPNRSAGNRSLYQDTAASRPSQVTLGAGKAILGETGKSVAGRVAHDWTLLHGENDVTVGMMMGDMQSTSNPALSDGNLKIFPYIRGGTVQINRRNPALLETTQSINWTLSAPAAQQSVWYTRSIASTSVTHSVYVNGAEVYSAATPVFRMLTRAFSPLAIAPYPNAILAEAVVANRVLTTAEMASVEAYWARYS